MKHTSDTDTKKRSAFVGFLDVAAIVCIAFLIRTFGYGLYRVPTGSMESTMLAGEFFVANKAVMLFLSPQGGDIISFNDPTFSYSTNKIQALFQRYMWGPSNWTKRVIGVPGDRMQGVIEQGKPVVYRNGVRLDESYVNRYPLIGVWHEKPKNSLAMSDEQVCQEWSFKVYDPAKPYGNQPWYAIDADCVICDAYGRTIVREPGELLQERSPADRNGNYWNGSDEFYVELGSNEYWVMGDNRLNSYDSRTFGPLHSRFIHGKIVYRLASVDRVASSVLYDILMHPRDFWQSIRWERCAQRVT
ncbi:MAG: signal peptidase I [Candidatus Dependentiae bacterium]|nr:signal peptidase I [Candidatus Dependentiae bacterium]